MAEDTFFEDLLALQAELKNPQKTKTADMEKYKYRYAELPILLDDYKPILASHNFHLSQVGDYNIGENGNVIYSLATVIRHKSGEVLTSHLPLTDERRDAQKFGSWMTYMRRYALLALLGLAEEDNDGQETKTGDYDVYKKTLEKLEKSILEGTADNVAERLEKAAEYCGDYPDLMKKIEALSRTLNV